MTYQYENGEVAWLKESVVNGVPTVAVEVVGRDAFGGLNVCKTKDETNKTFWVKPDELISSKDAAEMADRFQIGLN